MARDGQQSVFLDFGKDSVTVPYTSRSLSLIKIIGLYDHAENMQFSLEYYIPRKMN